MGGLAPRLTGPGALESGWREIEIAREQAGEDTGLARGDDRAECARGEESAPEQARVLLGY